MIKSGNPAGKPMRNGLGKRIPAQPQLAEGDLIKPAIANILGKQPIKSGKNGKQRRNPNHRHAKRVRDPLHWHLLPVGKAQ
jgi:hypothetical protein